MGCVFEIQNNNHMRDLISVLDKRAVPETLEQKLSLLAHDIIKLADEHQKRVLKIMPEFDLHDGTHLKKVEENIACILGEDHLVELSSIELFLLISASYLHDIGMAPADWELTLMGITEGTDKLRINQDSVCNDGKKVYSINEAKDFISKKKSDIYGTFECVCNWPFSPDTEEKLVSDLADLFVEYQEYRNGFIDQIEESKDDSAFKDLNDSIRTNFIRICHPQKSAEYIMNLEKKFISVLGDQWSTRLLSDLADVCFCHGEEVDEVRKRKTCVKYVGDETVNLQFVAEMLRLGDIIHYSSDRAPMVLQGAMNFKSSYSKQEWQTKIGLNYTISDGVISYMATCQTPNDYYHLQDYLDWVDNEIKNYDLLKKNWENKYRIEIHEVDRNNVDYDKRVFTPVIGQKFSLSQSKIIDLLMGVNLYKNPYSCIRELYQNALDACRCRIDIAKTKSQVIKGQIEFGIKSDKNDKILYCKDNGLGMSEYIIENYLLKIGNSFYKSADFYRKRSQWGCSFSPVSQFGIGILSCFIIGTKIEIITRSYETNKCICCCIEGAQEHFYYRKTTKEDEESLPDSGTIVKVFLKPDNALELNNNTIKKLGLALLDNNINDFKSYSQYDYIYKYWGHNLYNLLNTFVNRVPQNIELSVRFTDNSIQQIRNKPFSIDIGDLGLETEDKPYIDNIIASLYLKRYRGSLTDVQKYLIQYPIHLQTENIEFNTYVTMPLPGMPSFEDDTFLFRSLYAHGSEVSVDGISIEDKYTNDDVYLGRLKKMGCLNYIGEHRPALSVDRREIISYPQDYNADYRDITIQETYETVKIARDHIKKYKLENDYKTQNLIWKYVFNRLGCAQILFVNKMAETELGDFIWPSITAIVGQEITIRDLLSSNEITLMNYDHSALDLFGKTVMMALFLNSKEIKVIDDKQITIIKKDCNEIIPEFNSDTNFMRYLVPAEESSVFEEYDIVSNLYPIVPTRLINGLWLSDKKTQNSRAVFVHAIVNCYNELFFQDSRLVNPSVGLYGAKSDFFNEPDHYVHEFQTLKKDFQCMDFAPNFWNTKEVVPILAYIAPASLTNKDMELLLNCKDTEPDYYKGVIEGWTVLITNMKTENVVVKPGKVSRNEMVSALSDDFWKTYKEWTFKFLDGTIMSK